MRTPGKAKEEKMPPRIHISFYLFLRYVTTIGRNQGKFQENSLVASDKGHEEREVDTGIEGGVAFSQISGLKQPKYTDADFQELLTVDSFCERFR